MLCWVLGTPDIVTSVGGECTLHTFAVAAASKSLLGEYECMSQPPQQQLNAQYGYQQSILACQLASRPMCSMLLQR